MKILIVCTGNTCRSQMAEGWLKSLDARLEVFSAGTHPETRVNPFAIAAMKELGIDISGNEPKPVGMFLSKTFDYVIIVCNRAKDECPAFTGKAKHRLHIGFEDPADAKGTEAEVMTVYRRIRDEIKAAFQKLYLERIRPEADRAGSGI